VTPLDVELLRAWLRTEPGNCAAALPRLTGDERLPLLEQLETDELARVLAHAPVWWLAAVVTENPDLPWPDAIERLGLNPNVVHALRAIPTGQREALLGRTSARNRARLNRALALPKDRVAGVLDEQIRVCHADEPAAAVADRVARNPSEDTWIYVTDSNDRYVGQITLPALLGAPGEQRAGEIPGVQRPRVPTTLLLEDALRLPSWRGHESLPAADETGQFAGVLRLGTLARALRIDEDSRTEARSLDLVGSLLTLWVRLLVAVLTRAGRTP
jgi:Mg/Co/Ni transporter MgtE